MAENEHGTRPDEPGDRRGSTTEHLRHTLADAAKDDQDRAAQQRNAGVAILVLAVVVVLLLVAIVSGATDAFQP